MTKGAEAAERISDEIKASRSSGTYLDQFKLEDGKIAFLRFITDKSDIITALVHSYMPTKDKPAAWSGKWPEKMWGVCVLDDMFRLRDASGQPLPEYEEGYGDCYLHNAFAGVKDGKFNRDISVPQAQVYGLAVVRKPVKDRNGKISLIDEMTEHKDAKGTTHQVPKIVLVSQKYSNFWAPVVAAAYIRGTICDQDFKIERKENDYNIAALGPDPDLNPGSKSWEKYPATLELLGFDLAEYILDHATPDHYKRWFIPGQEPEGGYGKGSDDEAESAAEATAEDGPTPEVSADELAAFGKDLRDRYDEAK